MTIAFHGETVFINNFVITKQSTTEVTWNHLLNYFELVFKYP